LSERCERKHNRPARFSPLAPVGRVGIEWVREWKLGTRDIDVRFEGSPFTFMNQPKEKLSFLPTAVMLGVALLMGATIAYISYASGRTHDLAERQFRSSRQIQDTTNELLSLLRDAETGQRGFLITGRESYLEPYHRATAALPGLFQKFEETSRTRPDQWERAKALRPLVEEKLRELAQTVSLRRTQPLDTVREIVETDLGKNVMDDIRAKCAVIHDVAETRILDFTAQAEAGNARLRIVSTFGSLVLLGFTAILAVTVFRGLARREQLYRTAATNAEYFRVTLNSIGDGLIATGADKKITFINPVAAHLTGWTEAEAIGKSISDVFRIVHEDTRIPAGNPLEKAIATGAVVGLANHTCLIAKDGRELPIDDSGSPIRGSTGVIEGAVLIFRDISARRAVERQLNALNDQLTEFVDAAAHDLRTPLRSVATFSELLSQRYESELVGDGQEFLGQIKKGIQRMGQLLEDLLSYARASHFDSSVGPRVPMQGALSTALDNLSADIEASKAIVTFADTLPVVPVHDAHLVQLFQNLIGNAVKYRGTEEPRIHVSCNKSDDGWIVQVDDNGIGIEPQYRELIFKPFKRLHGEDRPGSGIGLATCQKIIAGYGGRIWVDSTPGKGSTFSFTIPLRK
jgi:PAS domain S-box-containing protein